MFQCCRVDNNLVGATLFDRYYKKSTSRLLRAIYPAHDWHPWKFPKVDKGFWTNPDNHRKYFEWLRQDLQLAYSMEDLLKLTRKDVVAHRGLKRLLVQTLSPSSHTWAVSVFHRSRAAFNILWGLY
jgi:hypothetical protein